MQHEGYEEGDWNGHRAIRLANGVARLWVVYGVGPRIVHYSGRGGVNVLAETPEATIETPLGSWKPYGGHRLWAAPESMPRSYVPDNTEVAVERLGERSVRLTSLAEPWTSIRKEMSVSLAAESAAVIIEHRITNAGAWPITLAPWAITMLHPGGTAFLPHEPRRTWAECIDPARPVVLWHYTDLSDPRWTLGPRFIRLRSNPAAIEPQKIGALNRAGWLGYARDGALFVKAAPYRATAQYPDFGCNVEIYAGGDVMELETLGPLTSLAPGESATHAERWALFEGVTLPDADEDLDRAILTARWVAAVMGS